MSAVVMVVGEGVLADCVYGELSAQYRVVRQIDFEAGVPEATELVLVLHDAWNPSIHQKAEEVLRPAGIPWLRGFVSFGEGVIGPLVRPGTPGCSQCADNRRLMAGRDRKEMWELQKRLRRTGEFRVMHGHRVRDFCRWLTCLWRRYRGCCKENRLIGRTCMFDQPENAEELTSFLSP